MDPSASPGERRRRIALALAPAIAALAFLPSVGGSFLGDDWALLAYSRSVRPGNLSEAFALGEGQYHYRPLPATLLAGEQALFGLEAPLYRIVKVALHGASACLVAGLARGLLGSATAGALAGALFAVHPAHSSAVLWIAATHETLVGFFFLGALLAALRFARGGGPPAGALAFALFLGALFSKETGATWPVAVAAAGAIVARDGRERRRLFALAATALVVVSVYAAARSRAGALPGEESGIRPRAAAVFENLFVEPFAFLVAPVNAAQAGSSTGALRGIGVAVLALAFVSAVAGGWSGRRAIAFGLALVPIAVSPVSPFLEVGSSLRESHYLYVPAAGFSIAFAAALCSPGAKAASWSGLLALVAWGGTLAVNNVPWREAGALSAEFARGVREAVPNLPESRPFAFVFVARPVEHKGIRVEAGHLLEAPLLYGAPLPPYPLRRGIGGSAAYDYFEDVKRETRLLVFYRSAQHALAEARAALARGETLERVAILEWDGDERRVVRLDPRAP